MVISARDRHYLADAERDDRLGGNAAAFRDFTRVVNLNPKHVDAQRELHRIGFDGIAGALDGGMDAWQSSGRAVSTFETEDIEDMAEWILSAEPMTVVDTRDEHEWAAGHVPGAVHLYVPDVLYRAGEIPNEAPVAVHCASGYRAGIAASLLEQAGLTRIIHVHGPYSDWDRLHLAESRP